MDDSEVIATLIVIGLAGLFWGRSIYSAATVFAPETPRVARWATVTAVAVLLIGFFIALGLVADTEVAGSFGYRILFTATAALSLRGLIGVVQLLGCDPIACGIQQNNVGATIASIGAALGAIAINVGANIGAGDTIATTLLPVVIGSAELAVFITVVAWVSGLAPRVSGSRSTSAGWRLAGLFVAGSLPIARAASGDWISLGRTLRDMALASGPLLVLVGAVFAIERVSPSFLTSRREGVVMDGVLFAVGFVGIGALFTCSSALL